MAVKVYWTRQSCEDLREIRTFIARDAPLTAAAFVRRIRESVKRARMFPELGQVVPELGRDNIREFLHGNYRVIYPVGTGRIDMDGSTNQDVIPALFQRGEQLGDVVANLLQHGFPWAR